MNIKRFWDDLSTENKYGLAAIAAAVLLLLIVVIF